MYSSRIVQLLVVAVAIIALGHATWLDMDVVGRSPNMLQGRQNTDSGTSRLPSSTTSSVPPPPTSTPRSSSSSTPGSSSTPSPSSTPSSSAGPSSTSGPGSQTSSLPSSTPGPSSSSPAPTSTPPPTSSDEGAAVTVTSYTVVETTDSAGSKTTYSTAAVYTQPANQNGGGGSGMSEGVKNIIIGVCVGVGGAIVLAVAGLLFWRLRSKKRQQDDQDDLAGTSQFNHGQDKSDHSGSTSGRSPFQSTLESYHAPTQTNTASNF